MEVAHRRARWGAHRLETLRARIEDLGRQVDVLDTLLPTALAWQRYPGVAYRRLLDDVSVEVHLVFSESLEPALAQALTAQRALFETAIG